MSDKLPTFPTDAKSQKVDFQAGDLLNFSAAVLAIASTAIFFIAGWVYEAYWYGFYGISLAQISLPTYQVMVEGVPGILVISLAFIIVIIYNSFRSTPKVIVTSGAENPQLDGLPRIILHAYYWASLFNAFLVGRFSEFLNPIPLEIIIATIGIAIVTVITFVLYLATNIRRNIVASSSVLFALLANSLTAILANTKLEAGFSTGIVFILLLLELISERLLPKLTQTTAFENFAHSIEATAEKITTLFRISWRVWVGLLFLFLLFLSIGISALLGRVDAAHGRRIMLGGWKMPDVYLSSQIDHLPLPMSIQYPGYDYGPLGLVFVNEQSYYFVDPLTSEYYSERPAVYIVPKHTDANYAILYIPQITTPVQTIETQPQIHPVPTNASAAP